MKKQIKILTFTLLILLITSSVLFFVMIDKEGKAADAPFPSENIATIAGGDISSVKVTLKNDSYTISKNNKVYEISGHDRSLLSQSVLELSLNALRNIRGNIVSENGQNKEEFGLASPRAVLEIKYLDNTILLNIGNLSAIGGVYVNKAESDIVYHVESLPFETLASGSLAFINLEVTTSPDSGAAAQGIRILPQAVTFSGTDYTTPLILEKKSMTHFEKEHSLYGYVISSHNNKQADKDATLDTLASLFEITAQNIAVYLPAPQQLADFGFNSPNTTVHFSYKTQSGTLESSIIKVSTDENGDIFLMKDEIPIIYSVTKEELPWLHLQYEDIVSRLVLVPDISTLAQLSISYNNFIQTFKLASKSDDISVTRQGKPIDIDRFKKLYEMIISLSGEQFALEKPDKSAKTLIRISYTYLDGKVDTLEIIEGPTLMSYISVNGDIDFLTKAKYAQIIIENLKILDTDTALTPLY